MMLQLDPRLIEDLMGKDLIAFGTGGLGKIMIPYLAQEPDIKLHGVTNSRVTAVDAGTFLNTGLPIRSLDTWSKLLPDATVLLCVISDNEPAAYDACQKAGFHKILFYPMDLLDMLQVIYNPYRIPTASSALCAMCQANELRDIHQAAFAEFKGCHRGRTVAVVATGPSLNHSTQGKGVPHIGVNSSYLKEGLKLDYCFMRHYCMEWCERLKEYSFMKFFARNEWMEQNHEADRFPEYLIEENQGRRFFTGEPSRDIHADITYYPLMGYYSIIFQALHFALYTRPKRLLLVGCDCSMNGHYDGAEQNFFADNPLIPIWIKGYKALKLFSEQHYPDMEIISVNPVGLKGLFHDMYTESYLDAHPELDRETCEIFDPKAFESQ